MSNMNEENLIDGLNIAYVEAITLRLDNGLWPEGTDAKAAAVEQSLALIDKSIGNVTSDQGLHLIRDAFNKIRDFSPDLNELPEKLIGGPGEKYSSRMGELDGAIADRETALGIEDVDRTSYGNEMQEVLARAPSLKP